MYVQGVNKEGQREKRLGETFVVHICGNKGLVSLEQKKVLKLIRSRHPVEKLIKCKSR